MWQEQLQPYPDVFDVNTPVLKTSQAIQGYVGRTGPRTEAKDTGDAWRIGKIFVQNIEDISKVAQRFGILDFDWCRSKDETLYPPIETTSGGVVGGPPIEGHPEMHPVWLSLQSIVNFRNWRLLHLSRHLANSSRWFPQRRLNDSIRSACSLIVNSNKSHNAKEILNNSRASLLISRRLRQSNWLPAIRTKENLTLGSPNPP